MALLAEGGDPYEQAIAEMGEFFPVGDRPRPKGMRKMADKDCYSNASHRIDTHGLVYGEGFAVSSSGFFVHHAWNLDADGVVVEPTWREVGHAYFGVRRNSVSYAKEVVERNWFGPGELERQYWADWRDKNRDHYNAYQRLPPRLWQEARAPGVPKPTAPGSQVQSRRGGVALETRGLERRQMAARARL